MILPKPLAILNGTDLNGEISHRQTPKIFRITCADPSITPIVPPAI